MGIIFLSVMLLNSQQIIFSRWFKNSTKLLTQLSMKICITYETQFRAHQNREFNIFALIYNDFKIYTPLFNGSECFLGYLTICKLFLKNIIIFSDY